MALAGLEQSLLGLSGSALAVSPGVGYPEPGMASIELSFTNGTRLEAEYWRLIVDDKPGVSSFDHRQKYGLPAPIDAVDTLRGTLDQKVVTNAQLDHKTGDLVFQFSEKVSLQVFNFTGYEIWHIRFADGTGEYSNYVK